jgi:hypothetical protein
MYESLNLTELIKSKVNKDVYNGYTFLTTFLFRQTFLFMSIAFWTIPIYIFFKIWPQSFYRLIL